MPSSLYIHIPFCASACPYCDFAFVVRKTHLSEFYGRALQKELTQRLAGEPKPRLSTISLGGGTPSAVPIAHLADLFTTIRSLASVDADAEITAEANPNDHASYQGLRDIGVNRLSIGAQAMDDDVLKALGRAHTADDIRTAVTAARRAGIINLNLDLIFGAPGQSADGWKQTLDRALDLGPDHLSVYGLTIEPGTPFWKRREKGRLELPEEELQAEMYAHALEGLGQAGFEQYEVSNFARPGKACRHNIACWERRPYIGLGLSAHSFLARARMWNTRDLNDYMERVESGLSPIDGAEELTDAEVRLEEILLDLRRPAGVRQSIVSPVAAERFLGEQLLERHTDRLRLTRSGLLLADWISAELAQEQPANGVGV